MANSSRMRHYRKTVKLRQETRRVEVARLYRKGETYRGIQQWFADNPPAEALASGEPYRPPSLGVIAKDIKAIMALMRAQQAAASDEELAMNQDRLTALLAAIWDKAMDGDLPAVRECRQILERQAKLLGLDAPTRTAIGGDPDNPVQVIYVDKPAGPAIDVSQLTDDELTVYETILARQEALDRAVEAAGSTNG